MSILYPLVTKICHARPQKMHGTDAVQSFWNLGVVPAGAEVYPSADYRNHSTIFGNHIN